MSAWKIESLPEALETALRVGRQTDTCSCDDEPHQNAMHDLANDLPDLIGPVGMHPDGSADPRVEAGAAALRSLGVPRQRAWDYADAALRAVFS